RKHHQCCESLKRHEATPEHFAFRRFATMLYIIDFSGSSEAALQTFGASVHGRHTRAAHLHEAERLHDRDELLDLGNTARNLENEVFRIRIDDMGTKGIRKTQRLHAGVALAFDLDQRKLAL